MKKVYLEKRSSDHEGSGSDTDVSLSLSMSLGPDTELDTVTTVMESEDMGLDDLDTLIQLELDNYTSCFGDMLNLQEEHIELQKNFYVDNESPSHSHSYEYMFPELIQDSLNRQPITTSGKPRIFIFCICYQSYKHFIYIDRPKS